MRDDFKYWTISKKTKHGYMIKCKKGLWRIDAHTQAEAEIEARRYFHQYAMDGEYKK